MWILLVFFPPRHPCFSPLWEKGNSPMKTKRRGFFFALQQNKSEATGDCPTKIEWPPVPAKTFLVEEKGGGEKKEALIGNESY